MSQTGQILTVSENASGITGSGGFDSVRSEYELARNELATECFRVSIPKFSGKTGVVTAVNVNNKQVQLLFFFPSLAAKYACWFPLTALQKPQRMWLVRCKLLQGSIAHTLCRIRASSNALATGSSSPRRSSTPVRGSRIATR